MLIAHPNNIPKFPGQLGLTEKRCTAEDSKYHLIPVTSCPDSETSAGPEYCKIKPHDSRARACGLQERLNGAQAETGLTEN